MDEEERDTARLLQASETDVETGGNEEQEEAAWDDDDIWCDDEEDAEADQEMVAMEEMDAWKAELATVTQPSINEAMLHLVPWGEVAREFVVNMIVVACFFGMHLVLHSQTLLELPVFVASTICLVVVGELLQRGSPVVKVFFIAAVLIIPVVLGVVFTHMEYLPPKHLPMLFFACLTGLSLCYLVCRSGQLHLSPLVQALSGVKYLTLRRRLDLVKVAKAMTIRRKRDVHADTDTMGAWVEWLTGKDEVFGQGKKQGTSRIVLGNVNVHPDPDAPTAALVVDGEEVPESAYKLVELCVFGTADRAPLAEVQTILSRKREITDKVLDSWLPGPSLPQDEKKPVVASMTPEQIVVRDWFFRRRLAPSPNNVSYRMKIRRMNHIDGAAEHWVVRALFLTIAIGVLSLPARTVVNGFIHMQQDLCADTSAALLHLPGGQEFCSDAKACEDACASILSFAERVNSVLHISYVEYLFVFILLPVFTLTFTVGTVNVGRKKLEERYLRGLQQTRKAIREVVNAKTSLELMLQTAQVLQRFKSRFDAWNPLASGDPELAACKGDSSANSDKPENGALAYVAQEMSAMISANEVDNAELVYGIRYDPDDDDAQRGIWAAWNSLVSNNALGGTSSRNFKAVFDVNVQHKETWEMWKKWLEEKYATQMKNIFNCSSDAQDNEVGCHLLESVVVGDQGVPKGFSLTHIMTTNPEDGSAFHILLDADMNQEKYKQEIKILEKTLSTPIDGGKATAELFQERLEESPITFRFSLSEQYYTALRKKNEEYKKLVGSADPPNDFTAFVGLMVQGIGQPMQEMSGADAGTMSSLGVVLGDLDPMRAMLDSGKVLLRRVFVYVYCLMFALIVPTWRYVSEGGDFFPQPFMYSLAINTLFSGLIMASFFSNFQIVSERLSFIAKALKDFEQQTINASGKSDKKNKSSSAAADGPAAGAAAPGSGTEGAAAEGAAAGGDASAAAAADSGPHAGAGKKAGRESTGPSPFDMTVNEAKDVLYDPEAPFWKKEWKLKQDNIQKWHQCAGYLRVYVTSSRLNGEAILIAAAGILAFLLVFSILQTLQGKGAIGVDVSALRDASSKAVGQITEVTNSAGNQAHEAVADARKLVAILSAAPSASVSSGSLLTAARDLKRRLSPLHDAIHAVASRHEDILSTAARRLGDSDEAADEVKDAMDDATFDATKITKTQLLTIAMVLLLMMYSVPLIWLIAQINDSFDRHGSLLMAQKEQHRLNQARRENQLLQGLTDEDESEPQEGEKAPPRQRKDLGARGYEKMLDMAIQSADSNKSRFSLRLFGFVINTTLLGAWIGLAGSPLVKQVKEMGLPTVMSGCRYLETGKISSLIRPPDEKDFRRSDNKMFFKSHAASMVHDIVCTPMKKMLQLKARSSKLAKSAKKLVGLSDDRRLRALAVPQLPPLSPSLEEWWAAHPGDAHAKLTVAWMQLDELEREANRVRDQAARWAVRAGLAASRSATSTWSLEL
eukprot:TRINITY_DN10546_c0_g1_i5.p1 TRINITY_DN10546_c0_g1~~TRINITY_DN10546_c0_g1_i5.p1  ORF type:complete len:1480 (+),score=312.74 TRINITY_DN10546_c0_g1_i5:85-4524(+)